MEQRDSVPTALLGAMGAWKMKVKELLSSPEKWTKGTWARDADGYRTAARCENAACWCILGAAIACYSGFTREYNRAVRLIEERIGTSNFGDWNDAPERTFEDVRQLVTELDI